MSKKKETVKAEDLLEALQDDRIIELLSLRLTKILTPTLEKIFNGFAIAFTSKLEELVEKSAESVLSKHCEKLNQNMSSLGEENHQLKLRIEDLERQSKQESLIIHGLGELGANVPQLELGESDLSINPLQKSQSIMQSVVNLCNDRLAVKIELSHISHAYRLSTKDKGKKGPVIVRFANQQIKNQIYASRKLLKDSGAPTPIYINEQLTKWNASLFAKARKLVKEKLLHSTWTKDGLVFVRLSGAQNEKPKRVDSTKFLDAISVKESI